MSEEIPGIRLVRHVGANFSRPDDPSFPFKLTVNCSPPEFMTFAFVGLFGGSEVIEVQGMDVEALQKFVDVNGFRTHPRLRHLTIDGPDGQIERFTREDARAAFELAMAARKEPA